MLVIQRILIALAILGALAHAGCEIEPGRLKKEKEHSAPVPVVNATLGDEFARRAAAANLTNSDSPFCTIKFRPESSFEYFTVDEVQHGVFVVPYDAGEPVEPYQGRDPNLPTIFRPYGKVPPFSRIACWATYAMKFKYEGIGGLQFFIVWQDRRLHSMPEPESVHGTSGKDFEVIDGRKVMHFLGAEVVLASNATGKYVIYPAEAEQPMESAPVPAETVDTAVPDAVAPETKSLMRQSLRQKSYFIFAEAGRAPYLIGRGRTVAGYANDTTVVVPCIASNYQLYVKLLWRNDKTGGYQFTADSSNGVAGIRYERTIGFIVNRRELLQRQGTKYPILPGEYRCVTESPADMVDVLVPEMQSENGQTLRIQVEGAGADRGVNAMCTGPRGSIVSLTHFTANHLEGAVLSQCLVNLAGAACGITSHQRQEGYPFNSTEYSVLTGIKSGSGVLVCTSREEGGSDVHGMDSVYYFTGLDGQIYTQPWQDVPIPAQLRLNIVPTRGWRMNATLIGGKLAHITCEIAGDISSPRFMYVTFLNGSRDYLGEIHDWRPRLTMYLQSTWKEVTCYTGPWDYSGSIYTTRTVEVTHVDCAANEFECANEACHTKYNICLGYGCEDGSSDSFNCTAYGCQSTPGDILWQCPSGRCVPEDYRCDWENDCKDDANSDEDLPSCQRDFTPVILGGSRDFKVVKGEELNIVCEVAYKRNQDKPEVEWSLVKEIVTVRLEINANKATKGENDGYDVVSLLHLENVTESNTYACTATNRFGTATATYRVEVYDPEPPTPETIAAEESTPKPQHPGAHQRFRCESEGKHPDPRDCTRFHECLPYEGASGQQFRHFEFSCAEGTVYCDGSQTCGYERDCPCVQGIRY